MKTNEFPKPLKGIKWKCNVTQEKGKKEGREKAKENLREKESMEKKYIFI